jgi:hypothetical protein
LRPQLWQPCQLVELFFVARCEQKKDGLGVKPPRDE